MYDSKEDYHIISLGIGKEFMNYKYKIIMEKMEGFTQDKDGNKDWEYGFIIEEEITNSPFKLHRIRRYEKDYKSNQTTYDNSYIRMTRGSNLELALELIN
jgi:hypothetical protein